MYHNVVPAVRNNDRFERVFANNTAVIYACEQDGIVYAQWYASIVDEAFWQAVEALFALYDTQKYVGYIADNSSGNPMPPEMLQAVFEQIFPRLTSTSIRFLTIIAPENLSIEMGNQAALMRTPPPFKSILSKDIQEALSWIKTQKELASGQQ